MIRLTPRSVDRSHMSVTVDGWYVGDVDKTGDGWRPVPRERLSWADPQTPTFRLRREAVAFLVGAP